MRYLSTIRLVAFVAVTPLSATAAQAPGSGFTFAGVAGIDVGVFNDLSAVGYDMGHCPSPTSSITTGATNQLFTLTCSQLNTTGDANFNVTIGGPIRTYASAIASGSSAVLEVTSLQQAGYYDTIMFGTLVPTTFTFFLHESASVTGPYNIFGPNEAEWVLAGKTGGSCTDASFVFAPGHPGGPYKDGPQTISHNRAVTCQVTSTDFAYRYYTDLFATVARGHYTNNFPIKEGTLDGTAVSDALNTAFIAGVQMFDGTTDVTNDPRYAFHTASGATLPLGAPVATPEPATMIFVATGLALIASVRRKKSR